MAKAIILVVLVALVVAVFLPAILTTGQVAGSCESLSCMNGPDLVNAADNAYDSVQDAANTDLGKCLLTGNFVCDK